jgi:rhodanese-related sulfurtransferase
MAKKPPFEGTFKALGELVVASLRSRGYSSITVAELRARLDVAEPLTIVDCRAATDFAEGHIPGALNVSYRTFMDEWECIPRGLPIVTLCYVGMYSRAASQRLVQGGHTTVLNLVGGMRAWYAAYGEPDQDE